MKSSASVWTFFGGLFSSFETRGGGDDVRRLARASVSGGPFRWAAVGVPLPRAESSLPRCRRAAAAGRQGVGGPATPRRPDSGRPRILRGRQRRPSPRLGQSSLRPAQPLPGRGRSRRGGEPRRRGAGQHRLRRHRHTSREAADPRPTLRVQQPARTGQRVGTGRVSRSANWTGTKQTDNPSASKLVRIVDVF